MKTRIIIDSTADLLPEFKNKVHIVVIIIKNCKS